MLSAIQVRPVNVNFALVKLSCAPDVPCRFLKGCRASRCKENGYICAGLQICCTGKTDSAGRKNLGAMSFAKSALQRSGWPILWNILLPSRLKNTDLGALGFRKTPLYRPARAFFQNILLPSNFIGYNMAAPRIWLTQLPRRISGISRSAGTSLQSAGPASRRWIPTKSACAA